MNKSDKIQQTFSLLEKIAVAMKPAYRQRIVSAIVLKGKIVSIGFNKKKSHPFQKKFAKHTEAIFLHSEVDCIKNALRYISVDDLKKCTMYVLRVKRPYDHAKHFVCGLAKPCEGCQRAVANFGIKTVYFTTDNGYDVL